MPLALTRPDLLRSANFIAGRWCDAPAARLAVTDPATGAAITEVPDSGAAEARAALDAAHAAFATWRKVPAKQRAAIIKRWNDLVLAHQDDLGKLISREQGKPLAEGKGEVAYAASYIEWFGEEATRMNGEIIPAPVPRVLGASSTMMESLGRRSCSVCTSMASVSGSASSRRVAGALPDCAAGPPEREACSRASTARPTLPTMESPASALAAQSGSSVSWNALISGGR